MTKEDIIKAVELAAAKHIQESAEAWLTAKSPRPENEVKVFADRVLCVWEQADQLLAAIDSAATPYPPHRATLQGKPVAELGSLADLAVIEAYDREGRKIGKVIPPAGTKAALLQDGEIIALAADGHEIGKPYDAPRAVKITSVRVVKGVDGLGPVEEAKPAMSPVAE